MAKYAHDTIVPDEGSKLEKKDQVAKMFDSIAYRYDFLNRFLSVGTDVGWRKKAIAELKPLQPRKVLDVATGTGDMAILTYSILRPEKITGIDISAGMLEVGRKKIEAKSLSGHIELLTGDSETIKFPDDSFDAITVAFGVRNFQNLENGLREMRRVLRPGGRLVVLEFSRPQNIFFKGIYSLYMNVIAPGFGKMFAKNKKAYRYLNQSVQAFPERQNFINILKSAGYRDTYYKTLSLGICSIYCGSK
ncbi:MAG TPA: bifunctional demethylmenaquinone methyltransferase/2-methoxy-6-polyprenyl-1,4-benzoquinol methylase UbiE [Chitinophagaceae bacterium]